VHKFLNSTIFTNSTILSNEDSLILCNLTNIPTNKSLSLVYQASRDGFKASDFHSKVNGVQGTFIIIQTSSSFVFGGYTEADWSGNNYKTDFNSFIYSLKNSFNKPLKMYQTTNNAIYASSSYGPTFGGGHDIYISDQSNINANSYSSINSYEIPSIGSSTSLLAGSYNFKTFEIEVYSVLIDRKLSFLFKIHKEF
jgi:hypothetical protein